MINEKINKSFLNISSPPFVYRNLAITQLIKYSSIIISKMCPLYNIYLIVFKNLFIIIVINNIHDKILLEISYLSNKFQGFRYTICPYHMKITRIKYSSFFYLLETLFN